MSDDIVKRLRDAYPATQDFTHTMQGGLMDEAAAAIEALTAERDLLRALLAEADRRIAWEAVGFGNDFADQVQAALKGATP